MIIFLKKWLKNTKEIIEKNMTIITGARDYLTLGQNYRNLEENKTKADKKPVEK
jgi:hypothetical protein